ncbi:MAG: FHA domain-containing protein [Actinomycetota bacterium]
MGNPCPTCGYENPLGARFCASCGIQLKADTRDESTVMIDPTSTADLSLISAEDLTDLPAGTLGVFLVRQGATWGRIALNSDEVSIGRHPESDIFLDDVTVSRRHAVVRRAGAGFHVSDAGSLNGTYVNQARVETAALNDGDEVQVGKFKLVYRALSGQG